MGSTTTAPVTDQPPAATAAGALDIPCLTRGMVRGDEAAFRSFHDHYYPRLWRYLLVVAAGDEDAARDALQATFIRIVRHAREWPDEASLWGWLTVVARTAHSDLARKHRRYLAFLDRFAGDPCADSSPPVPAGADEELLDSLRQNLATLPPDDRELLEQKYFEARSVRDLAAARGTSEKAVESRLVRLRRKLKSGILGGILKSASDRFPAETRPPLSSPPPAGRGMPAIAHRPKPSINHE